MYLRCPTLIQKQVSKNALSFTAVITFSMLLMLQIFTGGISLLEFKYALVGGRAEWLRRVIPKRKVSSSNPVVDKFV